MEQTDKKNTVLKLIAPLSGQVVPLDQVPDPTFAEKIMGDGVAIIPEDGKIYSPVTGKVAAVATTRHAFGPVSYTHLRLLNRGCACNQLSLRCRK